MANYTIELKDVVSQQNIFAFPYEFYNEKKRLEFENSFIRHFYFREIGTPTPDRFIHYLRDKMTLVFPYYNELLKTAEIEYSVLDNYNVTETFTRNLEKLGKSNGVFSSRGEVHDSQSNNVEDERTNTSENEVNVSANKNDTETTTTDGTSTQENNGSKTTVTEGKQDTSIFKSVDESVKKKFLDTPQGLSDLEDSKYVTTLNADKRGLEDNTDESKTTDETVTDTHGDTTTGNMESNSERKLTGNDTRNETQNGNEKSSAKTNTNFEGDQTTKHDNNTRTETKDNQKEDYELIRKGNIGVDTDADMIQKHIKLQKVLTQIYNMFFDECEDLFMLVY